MTLEETRKNIKTFKELALKHQFLFKIVYILKLFCYNITRM